ncbi:phenylacetic acid degradation operon negative regulatory protein PaaX [Xenorhabdus nematophila]|uniref:Transcriptional repressor for phenylacetic acid degradation n=1 Tax=Xenorhabdus nematophila (strain ATCC 19061 / DSM 3370 / CCUG 14189 / LMG 1036 / NCIMB 9965 / AN6) TaxID=406817 RepID=D3VFY7_XENNA|nr:phenylacetic acid degradation operon negative regulatory protein PaaX [Xenorhabdus nematophila]CEE94289.1 transcriptional repressor for phenylacetic acid degradation [Xenorhabdus nematophila str. Anatoliense]CEF29865.1 transcriptional repressor for phenylacetic acid degradation [Xenorhabdus nematophila str. Websteri]AYA41691.1 phenylacetic acid degradation operon negative regulatory protein PaaX [Xenorhabdus nematophila]KHD29097.1 phenylacetic acid degradation protein [Xenorhabdus nematophil
MAHKLNDFIRHALDAQPISGTSLIISLYGDAFSHRGGEVWLGSLSLLLEPMGFSDRFVRTSVFRLQKEGWLKVEKLGRRSYYRITEHGMNQFRHAESKIYLSEQPEWDGKWDLLLLEGIHKDERPRLKKELSWLGFGQLNSTLMAAPSRSQRDIPTLLGELNASDAVIYFRADYPYPRSEQSLKEQVSASWSLEQVSQHYHEFIVTFRPLMALLRDCHEDDLTPERCFQLRLLLIHFYRRVVLRDPLLPDALLPAQWEGLIARNLCINIYQRIDLAATRYISEHCETTIGRLPQPAAAYYRRFGGLHSDWPFQ